MPPAASSGRSYFITRLLREVIFAEQGLAGSNLRWERRRTLMQWGTYTLALLLLVDQFPRNLYRHSAHAFATDEMARSIADRALALGFDAQTDASLRAFFYLPFEHHEDAASQARAVALFKKLGDKMGLEYAQLHADLIARFGRFPHRNAVMGRISSAEEIAYLAQGGFAG